MAQQDAVPQDPHPHLPLIAQATFPARAGDWHADRIRVSDLYPVYMPNERGPLMRLSLMVPGAELSVLVGPDGWAELKRHGDRIYPPAPFALACAGCDDPIIAGDDLTARQCGGVVELLHRDCAEQADAEADATRESDRLSYEQGVSGGAS